MYNIISTSPFFTDGDHSCYSYTGMIPNDYKLFQFNTKPSQIYVRMWVYNFQNYTFGTHVRYHHNDEYIKSKKLLVNSKMKLVAPSMSNKSNRNTSIPKT